MPLRGGAIQRGNMEFFGVVDHKDGDKRKPITSTYPAWYFDGAIENMERQIDSIRIQLESGSLPEEMVPRKKADLKRHQERMQEILDSRPKLEGKEETKVARAYDEIGKELRDKMPTYDEMNKGLVNPHEEVRRDNQPSINIKNMGHVQLFRSLNIHPDKNGNISRNQAKIAWKIMGKSLGTYTNTERLRRTTYGGTYKSEPTIEQMIERNK